MEARTQSAAPFAAAATAPASLAAVSPVAATPSATQEEIGKEEKSAAVKANGAAPEAIGISPEQVAEIKAGIQAQQKFLGELLDQSNRWELDGSELRVYFSPDKRPFAELLEGRDSLEKLRVVSSKVLGRAVRVCAKLDAVAAAASAARGASGTQELRAQFERDPMVRSMLQRFGGKISEVKRSQEES
jgi:hypothetical protein